MQVAKQMTFSFPPSWTSSYNWNKNHWAGNTNHKTQEETELTKQPHNSYRKEVLKLAATADG